MSGSAKIEFAVQMSGPKCAEKVRECLAEMGQVDINLELGRVIVDTTVPWSEVQEKIENTGRRAVLSGFGGQSAVAMINAENNNIKGVVRFSAADNNKGCLIDGTIDGLKPGSHGIHINETGDLSCGCESLGEHYNPHGSPHGAPTDLPSNRHVGDLGNIIAEENGRATFRFVDPLVEVRDIIGRSVSVTEFFDDFGKTNDKTSSIDGNSGQRLACGIIARSAGIYQNYKKLCACDGVTIWDERDKPLAGGNRNQTGKL